jgi:hypothetical protein
MVGNLTSSFPMPFGYEGVPEIRLTTILGPLFSMFVGRQVIDEIADINSAQKEIDLCIDQVREHRTFEALKSLSDPGFALFTKHIMALIKEAEMAQKNGKFIAVCPIGTSDHEVLYLLLRDEIRSPRSVN